MTKLKNCKGNKTQKFKVGQNWNQVLAKLKNSNLDKTEKLKLWQNWTTQIVKKTQQLRSGQNSKTITVKKL